MVEHVWHTSLFNRERAYEKLKKAFKEEEVVDRTDFRYALVGTLLVYLQDRRLPVHENRHEVRFFCSLLEYLKKEAELDSAESLEVLSRFARWLFGGIAEEFQKPFKKPLALSLQT